MIDSESILQVIRAGGEQLDALAPLFDGYRQFYQQESDLEGARGFLKARLEKGESVIFLALDAAEGKALGFTQLYPMFSSVSMEPMWILNDLFVTPPGRKRGVGEALMQAAFEFARASGAKGMQLETAVDNHPAQRLYERLGWTRETNFYTYWIRTKAGQGPM